MSGYYFARVQDDQIEKSIHGSNTSFEVVVIGEIEDFLDKFIGKLSISFTQLVIDGLDGL